MTEKTKTVTDHLLEAQTILDLETVTTADIDRARECIERALDAIQLARQAAMAALDEF